MRKVVISVKPVGVRVVLKPKSALNGHPVGLRTVQSKATQVLVSLEVRWEAAASLADQKSSSQGRVDWWVPQGRGQS